MIKREILTKKQVNDLKALQKRKERYQNGFFLAEGLRTVEQILENGRVNVTAVISDETLLLPETLRSFCTSGYEDETVSVPRLWDKPEAHVPNYAISSRLFRQIADTDSPQGVLAVCRIPEQINPEDVLKKQGLLLAVDRIQDPGNLGTLIRTAVWFGVSGLILAPGTADLYHPKVVRSTAGATGVLPWLETELSGFLQQARAREWQVYLLDASEYAKPYRDVVQSGRDVIVAGNEANGIASFLLSEAYEKIKIEPVKTMEAATSNGGVSGVESLNVSIASAVVMAHFQARKAEKGD